MTEAGVIALHGVSRTFPSGVRSLNDLSLTVDPGEFVSLLGPSGCGKSTVLRLAAGLDRPSTGTVDSPALRHPERAETAFVFQDPTLMPWASVFDNVYLPLRVAGLPRAAVKDQIHALLAQVGLADFTGHRPAALSGGMRMRASIARALVTAPKVLLMDEPFAALDEITRGRLNQDLLAWWMNGRMGVLFVTHSVYEAVFLSQRVLVMSARPGRVVREIIIDAPYPRTAAFRSGEVFQAACRSLTEALDLAHREALS